MSIFSSLRREQKWKFTTEEVLNAVLDSTEEYMDFESESDTDTVEKGPGCDIFITGGQSKKDKLEVIKATLNLNKSD